MHAAVISDDLTGAADTAAPFARAGYRTAVAFRGSPVQPAEDLNAVAVDTDSRALPADVTKAGAFGEPDTLRRVVEMLLESAEETGL